MEVPPTTLPTDFLPSIRTKPSTVWTAGCASVRPPSRQASWIGQDEMRREIRQDEPATPSSHGQQVFATAVAATTTTITTHGSDKFVLNRIHRLSKLGREVLTTLTISQTRKVSNETNNQHTAQTNKQTNKKESTR